MVQTGLWFTVTFEGKKYNVLFQGESVKDVMSNNLDTMIVLDENFVKVEDYELWDKIEDGIIS